MNQPAGPPRRTHLVYRVPYADTDQMGFVYYANYFVYFERLRNEVIREMGHSYRELEEKGVLLPVIESYCRHLAPAVYDDLLDIHGWFEPVSRTRLRACCEVSREGRLLASGHTVHASLAAGTLRPVRLPEFLMTGPAA